MHLKNRRMTVCNVVKSDEPQRSDDLESESDVHAPVRQNRKRRRDNETLYTGSTVADAQQRIATQQTLADLAIRTKFNKLEKGLLAILFVFEHIFDEFSYNHRTWDNNTIKWKDNTLVELNDIYIFKLVSFCRNFLVRFRPIYITNADQLILYGYVYTAIKLIISCCTKGTKSIVHAFTSLSAILDEERSEDNYAFPKIFFECYIEYNTNWCKHINSQPITIIQCAFTDRMKKLIESALELYYDERIRESSERRLYKDL